MRELSAGAVAEAVARLCIRANTRLPRDVKDAIARARREENWPAAREILDRMIENGEIGGTFDKCALLAKKALLRDLGAPSPNTFYAHLERELLDKINALGIGPQGVGGRTTALAVHLDNDLYETGRAAYLAWRRAAP